jgi:hypothetical protein
MRHTGANRCLWQTRVPASEWVKKYKMLSFRGAGAAREPGTYEHRQAKGGNGPWSWVPGPALRAVPE